jgi:hypothetical protein
VVEGPPRRRASSAGFEGLGARLGTRVRPCRRDRDRNRSSDFRACGRATEEKLRFKVGTAGGNILELITPVTALDRNRGGLGNIRSGSVLDVNHHIGIRIVPGRARSPTDGEGRADLVRGRVRAADGDGTGIGQVVNTAGRLGNTAGRLGNTARLGRGAPAVPEETGEGLPRKGEQSDGQENGSGETPSAAEHGPTPW